MNLYSNNFKLISIGNRKIYINTIIFNCSSYENCTSRKLGLCSISNICYARKAEYLYKKSKVYRDRQEEYIVNTPINQIEYDFRDTLEIGKRKEKIKYLRLNESGDFQNIEILNKLDTLASYLKKNYGIITYTYTHRSDLLKQLEQISNINIIGSGFKINGNITRVFDNIKDVPSNYYICKGGANKSAAKCNKDCFFCSNKTRNKKLALIKH